MTPPANAMKKARTVKTATSEPQPGEGDVFEPFVQLNWPRSLFQERTGLGLPLCKQLVESNGGTINIESKLGEGTEVTLRFPAERSIPR